MPQSRVRTYVAAHAAYEQGKQTRHAASEAQVAKIQKEATERRKELERELSGFATAVEQRLAEAAHQRQRAEEQAQRELEATRPGNFSIADHATISVQSDGSLLLLNDKTSARTTIPADRVDAFRGWLNQNYGPASE